MKESIDNEIDAQRIGSYRLDYFIYPYYGVCDISHD
jgi:hypothetical protein